MCSEDALLIKFIKDNPLVKRNINFYKPLFLFIYLFFVIMNLGILHNMPKYIGVTIQLYMWKPATACNFTRSNAPWWMFFTFFKLYKVANRAKHHICEKVSILWKKISHVNLQYLIIFLFYTFFNNLCN